jgi:tRNA A37 threonylcarbamoyladenosine dehydratase
MFYGREGFEKLQKSLVAVVGLGGVGAAAAEALVRAGVGRMIVIDCDVVKPTDINRQLFALTTTVGRTKTDLAAERLLAINPSLDLTAINAFFHSETAGDLIPAETDFVIDAIDSLNPKVELIRHCAAGGIRIISAMGAAGRKDPSRVSVARLDKTVNCPLARTVRRYLRRRNVSTDIPVVYSSERPVRSHPDAPAPSAETADTYLRGRPRQSLPTLSTIPAVFGLFAAGYVLTRLLE